MQQAAVYDPLIGHTIGNYKVTAKIGDGGMGTVYLAEHPLIGKKVALKVLHPEFSSNDDMALRFFHEAKAVNDIQHPNIVDILDYGVIPDQGQKTVYFIMEFLDGYSLAQLIRSQAPLPPEHALAIALQIADALSASHKRDIIHRDLKPDNVMLIQRGREQNFVKVLDFGIAKLTGDHHPGSRRTRTGIVMGTPAYMSPEQCEGKGDVDQRTDIYALGILLYEMLTGQVPFKGEGFGEILVKHLTQPPTRLSQITPMIPPHVEAVVMKALEKNPDNRYPDMEEFMRALADPVGYVEQHGGLSGFLSASLTAGPVGYYSQHGVPLGSQHGVHPSQIMSPVPGQISPMYTPTPGTLQASAGTFPPSEMQEEGGSGLRITIIAMVTVVVLGLGIGGYLFLFKKQAAESDGDTLAGITDTTAAQNGQTGTSGQGATTVTTPDEVKDDKAGDNQGIKTDGTTEQGGTKEGEDGAKEDEGATAAAEMVLLNVVTDPKGAEVFLNDETEPRGKTPLELAIPKSPDKVTLTVRRDKFREETRTFTPDKNQDFDLKLSREKAGDKKRVIKRTVKGDKKTDKDNKDNTVDKDVGLAEPDWD